MRIKPDKFQETITMELKSLQDRVRYLIADGNWAEEGRYKEEILKSVISKKLSNNLSIGTGFVVDQQPDGNVIRSKQIDIIIYDNTIPLIFKEGDFVITTPRNVKAVIEVKTVLLPDQDKMGKIANSVLVNSSILPDNIFHGIFAYNEGRVMNSIPFRNALKQFSGKVDHICLGENIFIKYWSDGNPRIRHNDNRPCFSFYKVKNMAFSYFISNLIEKVSVENDFYSSDWILYPIEGGKESKKMYDVFVEEIE